MNDSRSLPAGVLGGELDMHPDIRGHVTELFRASWLSDLSFVQWTVLSSDADVLRGMHVHLRQTDYLVVLHGRSFVGLRDLRSSSPTEGLVSLTELTSQSLNSLLIPPGVAHGFYSDVPTIMLLGTNRYYDPSDQRGCRWDDPDLAVPWPIKRSPTTAPHDATLPSFKELILQVRESARYASADARSSAIA
jgi:dTDP-4-dehydrorhamnose 3,5-epimerase